MTFEEFLKLLPKCPGSEILPLEAEVQGMGYREQGLTEFIGPDLLPSNAIAQPEKPQVMIIAAAGAVGKSTLANEIAYRKQALIWDLAQARAVGGTSMTGRITDSFGFNCISVVSEKLLSGELFILVDALDEARVKANEAGYEAFVANIADILQKATGIPFILIGRTQTAETTWLLLDDAGISASLISIQPFTREQAEQYIEARIQSLDKTAAKRIEEHTQPFVEARNLILNHLKRAVVGEEAVSEEAAHEFLGYAPVLEAVAVMLTKEGNFIEFTKSLDPFSKKLRNDSDRPLEVLNHVVTRLLEREQFQKLQFNIRPALEMVAAQEKWHSWDDLYTPEEQIARLLGRILNIELDVCPDMPSSVRSIYEEQLEAWFPEHPFLSDGCYPANKVFESFLFANAMRQYMTPLSRFVEERVMAREYKPSRLLAEFYILLGEQAGEEIVVDRQIGLLYDSLLAGETDLFRINLSIEAGDPDEPDEEVESAEGEFEFVYTSLEQRNQYISLVRRFEIKDDTGVITFKRQLKEASIVTRNGVCLGANIDDFEIGPAVLVQCRRMQIHSPGLVVRATRTREVALEAVVLNANECDSAISQKPIVRGSFVVSWPGSQAYPWSDYNVEVLFDEPENQHLREVYRRLRRFVTSLRSHSKGSLARVRDKLEHRRVVKNDMGRALLDQLLRDGIFVLQGKFYHWVPEKGDITLGSSYEDLRKGHITPQTRDYLNTFIQQNQHVL